MSFKSISALADQYIGDPPELPLDPPEPQELEPPQPENTPGTNANADVDPPAPDDIDEAMPTIAPEDPPEPPSWIPRCACGAAVLNDGDRCDDCALTPDPPETEPAAIVGHVLPAPTGGALTPEIADRLQKIASLRLIRMDALATHAIEVSTRAAAITTIADEAGQQLVDGIEGELFAVERDIDAEFQTAREAAYDLWQIVLLLVKLTKGDTPAQLKRMKNLLSERARWVQAENARRQREANELAQKAEQQRLLEEARHAERVGEPPEVVQAIQEQAKNPVVPPVRLADTLKAPPTRKNWKSETLDKARIAVFVVLGEEAARAPVLKLANPQFLNLIDSNETALTQLAKSQENGFNIPGARAFDAAIPTKRRA